MTTFIDGPAAGQPLMLRRAARFIRVVESDGKWDALDQPEDTPKPDEKIYAYEVRGEVGSCHIQMRGKYKGGGGFYPIASYGFVEKQPDDATMRDTAKWRQWCSDFINMVNT